MACWNFCCSSFLLYFWLFPLEVPAASSTLAPITFTSSLNTSVCLLTGLPLEIRCYNPKPFVTPESSGFILKLPFVTFWKSSYMYSSITMLFLLHSKTETISTVLMCCLAICSRGLSRLWKIWRQRRLWFKRKLSLFYPLDLSTPPPCTTLLNSAWPKTRLKTSPSSLTSIAKSRFTLDYDQRDLGLTKKIKT